MACNISRISGVAAEEHADYGPLSRLRAPNGQIHQLYGVVDRGSKAVNVELGAGFGLTSASDRLTLKLILSRDLF